MEGSSLGSFTSRVHPMASHSAAHDIGQHNGSTAASDGNKMWASRRGSTSTTGSREKGGLEVMTCDSIGSAEVSEPFTDRTAPVDGRRIASKQQSTENGPSSGMDRVSNSDSKDVTIDFANVRESQQIMAKDKHDRRGQSNPSMSAPYRRLDHPADKSLMVSFIGGVVFLVAALVVFCPTAVLLLLCLPLSLLVRQFMLCCCCARPRRTCLCCCSQMLSHSDAVWLHDSALNRAVLQSLVTIEEGLNLVRLRDLVDNKLVSAQSPRNQRLHPRLTQKVVPLTTGYMWVPDEEFSIERHVYAMPDNIRTEADLKNHVATMAVRGLPTDHPMWDIQVLANFGEKKDTVLLIRVHQCMCDGLSLLRVLINSFSEGCSLHRAKPRLSRGAFFLNSMRAIATGPLVFINRWLLTRRDYNILHAAPLSGRKAIAWSQPFSVARAIRIKQVTRSTLNDVLLSAAAGCLRTFLQTKGVGNPYDMLATIPTDLSTSSGGNRMKNCVTYIDMTLPTNIEGSIPRLWEVKNKMAKVKHSPDAFVLRGVQWLMTLMLPACIWRRIFASLRRNATCMVANLPGPDSTVLLASHQVRSILAWSPPPGDAALAISFLTYGDQLRMSVIADEEIVSDPTILTKDFILQMEKLSHLLSHRRIPGEHPGRRVDHLHDEGLHQEPTVEEKMVAHIQQELWDIKVAIIRYFLQEMEDTHCVSDMERLQAKMAAVQQQLQDLKARLDTETADRYSEEERALVDRVEQLKEEFRELLAELRRKRLAQGSSVLSDDEEDEDGELRRSSHRKRTLSGTSRRSVVSASASSTTRPLTTTSPPHSANTSSPVSSRPNSPCTPPPPVSARSDRHWPAAPSGAPVSYPRRPLGRFHTVHHPPSSHVHVESIFVITCESSSSNASHATASLVGMNSSICTTVATSSTVDTTNTAATSSATETSANHSGFSSMAKTSIQTATAGYQKAGYTGVLSARNLLSLQENRSQSLPSLVSPKCRWHKHELEI